MPRRTRDAVAEYPLEALIAGITGSVILELVVDPKGNVREARVVRSVRELDGAAVKAARKWKYAPTIVRGKAIELVTYGIMRFGLTMEPVPADWLTLAAFHYEGGRLSLARMALDAAMVKAQQDGARFRTFLDGGSPDSEVSAPEKIKDVQPTLPVGPLRLKSGNQWQVVIEALLDTQGNVARAQVVSKPSIFDASALEAILQWKYKPAMKNGSPVAISLTVTVNFRS